MAEWWSYRPEDMLLFSPRVYWRMFELHNAAVWPLHLLTVTAGLGAVLLALGRAHGTARWVAFILAILWVFVGWSFLWLRYSTINWAIDYLAPLFLLQAGLLVIAGILPHALVFDRRHGVAGWNGLAMAITALFLYPLLALAFNWRQAEVFGIAPDPTAIGTLGLLLMTRGAFRLVLLPIPALWCLVSGLTLWTMEEPTAWLPIAAVIVTLATYMLPTGRKS
ncbi:DUF6064 family protein [Phyllobacterium lublinensis]|uniref:DUF6064 family protein n=1 Tax=Phyllobacterium lublinensis TaxID=2875708 RepID=UPI001CCF3BBE|nr:DUF6064 family protein [Phyllobacterium sp. 2063]MBZ9654537.1 DUF6064 family protein [Phyllobacterium sp. 2063]